MKVKNLTVLVTIFLGLCLIAGLYHYWSNKQKGPQCFIDLDKEDVSKIEIIKKEEVFVFEKKETLWQIMKPFEYRADQASMVNLIDSVGNIILETVISTNPQKYWKFQVDQKEGIVVKFYNKKGEQTVDFILGKMGTDYLHYYFRFPDKQKVYLSRGLSRNFVDKEAEKWRDKTILALNKNALEEISLICLDSDKKGKKIEEVKVTKNEDKWLVGKEEVDSNVWDSYLNNLTRLNMDDLVSDSLAVEGKKEFGLQKPSFQIKIKLKDNQEEGILVGNKNEKNQYYVQRKGVETIFLVSSYKIDNLKKKSADLIKKGD
ncbi:DUF4340 domain-containing protein [bacterium]|nr:DUF4340 domain-containing protein [bacterium]